MAPDLGRRLLLPHQMTRPLPRPPRLPSRTLNAIKATARSPTAFQLPRRRRPPPRVFVLSDLHTDYEDNMSWVKRLSAINFRNDVLLVAGDVAESFAGKNCVVKRERFFILIFPRLLALIFWDPVLSLSMGEMAAKDLAMSSGIHTSDGMLLLMVSGISKHHWLIQEKERKRKINGDENWLPFCMFHDGLMSDGSAPCYWSYFYSRNEREPENTELSPWVFGLYAK